MKKKYLAFAAAIMLAMLTITGCSSNEKAAEKTETQAAQTEAAETEAAKSEEKIYTAEEILSCHDYDIKECVKLNDYMNMTVDISSSAEITDEDVESLMQAFASMYPNKYVATDRQEVQDGDIVKMDYVGYHDGEAFDGGTATDAALVIGSGAYVEGFESGLVGAKVGEKTEVKVTFPDNYSEASLAGEDAVFEVTVKEIREPQTTTYEEIDDQWVTDNFAAEGFQTITDLKNYIVEYLKSLNDTDEETKIQNAIIGKIVEESEITIPEGYLELRIENYKETIYKTVEESGKTFEERMGVTEEEFLATLPSNMETRIKKDLVLEAITADLGITVTESEYNDYVNSYLSYYSFTEKEQLFEQLGKLSELDGEDYCLLGYAEHQAWVQVKKVVQVNK